MRRVICVIVCFLVHFGVLPNAMGSAFSAGKDLLTTSDDHLEFIKSSLKSAQERVIIVSPYISINALQDNRDGSGSLKSHIKDAVKRISVCIYADARPETSDYARAGRDALTDMGVDFIFVDRLHSKNLIVDDVCVTFGSFNWLSANTNPASRYHNYETTTIIRGTQASPAIDKILEGLLDLRVTEHRGVISTAIVDYIEGEDDLRGVLDFYRSTQNSYLRSACANVLGEHLVFCHDYNSIFKILKETVHVDAEEYQYFVDQAMESLVEYCDESTSKELKYVEKFFGKINKNQVVDKIKEGLIKRNGMLPQ